MTDIMATTLTTRITLALVAFVMLWCALKAFDYASGFQFESAIKRMQDVPTSMAVYYGFRFVGCCVLLGMLLSW